MLPDFLSIPDASPEVFCFNVWSRIRLFPRDEGTICRAFKGWNSPLFEQLKCLHPWVRDLTLKRVRAFVARKHLQKNLPKSQIHGSWSKQNIQAINFEMSSTHHKKGWLGNSLVTVCAGVGAGERGKLSKAGLANRPVSSVYLFLNT